MSGSHATGEVPPVLRQRLSGRDDSPLPEGALVRYQLIGLAPGIGKNFRFVLFSDGRLFAAANSAGAPADDEQVFNTALPEIPTATVAAETVARVEEQLRASEFTASAPYLGNQGVRDGSVMLVTARVDDALHEVWYQNVSTELTDLLSWLYHEEAVDQSSLDELFAQFADVRTEGEL